MVRPNCWVLAPVGAAAAAVRSALVVVSNCSTVRAVVDGAGAPPSGRAWGRVPVSADAAGVSVAPDLIPNGRVAQPPRASVTIDAVRTVLNMVQMYATKVVRTTGSFYLAATLCQPYVRGYDSTID